MEIYRIGAIIREIRNRKNISQEELCFGICAVSTLSRIENGEQKPSLKVEEALLERLGHSTENLTFYADADEFKKHELEQKIRRQAMHRESIQLFLRQYRELLRMRGTATALEEQFLRMSEATQGSYTREWDLDHVLKELEESLLLTIPDYCPGKIPRRSLFTNTEIQILNNIAIAYAKQERTHAAIQLFMFLINIIEERYMEVYDLGKTYPMLICNLIRLFEKTGSIQEIQEYAEKGIAYCVENNRMQCLPDLVYYSGLVHQDAGDKEKALARYRQALSLLELVGREKAARGLEKDMEALML